MLKGECTVGNVVDLNLLLEIFGVFVPGVAEEQCSGWWWWTSDLMCWTDSVMSVLIAWFRACCIRKAGDDTLRSIQSDRKHRETASEGKKHKIQS